jgi:hypothetical protein
MFKLTSAAVLAALAVQGFAVQAAVLDFGNGPPAPTICSSESGGGGSFVACSNYTRINQAYGDVDGVLDVTYSTPRIQDSSTDTPRWWGSNYNDLYGVLFAYNNNADSLLRIELKPLNGQGVKLNSLDLGAYPNTVRNSTLKIFDLSGSTELFSFGGAVGTGDVHTAFVFPDIVSTNGIRIEVYDSAWDNGIDNIAYEMTAAIPEPGTYALMALGLLAVGAATRRRS